MIANNNCIFQPNTDISNAVSVSQDNKYYTILGEHDFVDDNNYTRTKEETKLTYAKSVVGSKKEKFYIKTGPYGRVYNPMGLFDEGKGNKFVAKLGKKEFEFTEVNYKIFEMYVKFLSTKNLAWLNNAERELV